MRNRRKTEGRFKTLSVKSIYRGRIFELNAVRMKAPDGHVFQHEVIFHPGAAVIVPVLDQERFVLVRQFRAATGKVIWEFPAGTLEKGESPLTCAKREIIEETGFEARGWLKLASFYPAPGISTELMHIFLATKLAPAEMALDRDEFLERRIVPFERLHKMILNGTVEDSKTIVGFFFYCQKKSH